MKSRNIVLVLSMKFRIQNWNRPPGYEDTKTVVANFGMQIDRRTDGQMKTFVGMDMGMRCTKQDLSSFFEQVVNRIFC